MELFSPGHIVVLAIVVAVLFFGWKQLPDMSRSLGRSLRIFKTEIKGMNEDDKTRNEANAPEADRPAIDAATPDAATPDRAAPADAQPAPPLPDQAVPNRPRPASAALEPGQSPPRRSV